jgi:hypothetical protein
LKESFPREGLGGECIDDMKRLRDDAGLAAILPQGRIGHLRRRRPGSGWMGFTTMR